MARFCHLFYLENEGKRIENSTKKIISLISQIKSEADKLIVNELKKYDLSGLCTSHGAILNLLYKNINGVSLKDITVSIHKDKSTVTSLVNKLEKMGFVKKIKNSSDSRSTILKLTSKGRATEDIVKNKISKKLLDNTYNGFSEDEKKNIMILLERVKQNFFDNEHIKGD